MSLYTLKMYLKKNPCINRLYNLLWRNKRDEQAELMKRKAVQEYGKETLQRIEQLLSNQEIEYFLNFGSLLGMIREKCLMEHDNDIDYGICIDEDFDWKILENILINNGFKKKKQFKLNGKITEQNYWYNGLGIDFFGHYSDGNHSYEYEYVRKNGYIYHSPYEYHVSKSKFYKFEGVRKVLINDIVCTIPNEAEKYLESIYGADWKIPNPNWHAVSGPAWDEQEMLATVEYFD